MALLEVEQLTVRHRESGHILVDRVDFVLERGQCLGIAGESGSGKTLLCRALMGILPPTLHAEGRIFFDGIDILAAPQSVLRTVRGQRIGMILQQPMTAFDPLYTIGRQMAETLAEKLNLTHAEAYKSVRRALGEVNLPETAVDEYPHRLSGGMLQRCMIAQTLALGSDFLIADEPTTALDARNQYTVLDWFIRLRRERQMTMIFVSHDLGAVQVPSDRVLVMCRGRIVESGSTQDVFNAPKDSYTQYMVKMRLALGQGFKSAETSTVSSIRAAADVCRTEVGGRCL